MMKKIISVLFLLLISYMGFSQVPVTNTATLNGSASYDPDGSIVKYAWVQTSGTATTINHADSSVANVVYAVAGTYQYTLNVTDNDGATSSANVTVTVYPANIPPKAVISASQINIKLPK
jgi:hypothetical protein